MKSFRLNRVIFSVIALVLGIVLLIWPADSLFIIAKCIGIILAGGSLAAGFMYYRDHDSALKSVLLILAVVMLICGVVIFLHPEELIKLIPTIVGILVMVSGLINLGETFVLTRSKYGKWWISLIIAIITIALGVFIVNKAFSLATLITRIAGGVLIFDGISHLWVISRISKTAKEAGATVEGTAVDVEPKEPGGGAGGGSAAAAGTAAETQNTAQGMAANGAASNFGSAVNNGAANSTAANGAASSFRPAVNNEAPNGAGPGVQNTVNREGQEASDYLASAGGQFAHDDEDDTPGYMKQEEQETDFLRYTMQNPVNTDASDSGDGESGR